MKGRAYGECSLWCWLPELSTPILRLICFCSSDLAKETDSGCTGATGQKMKSRGSLPHPSATPVPLPMFHLFWRLTHLSVYLSVHPHRVVFFASVLMRKVMASRVRATVLFATETGKSEALARDLAALFSYAFNTKVPT